MNILLIPTTNSALTNISCEYERMAKDGDNIFIISDNIHISQKSPGCFQEINFSVQRLLQKYRFPRIIQIAALLFIKHSARMILKSYSIDVVVVTNDNSLIQNIFVNRAKELGILTITHQAAAISYMPSKESWKKKLRNKLTYRLFRLNSGKSYAEHTDFSFIQGVSWKSYLPRNSQYLIVGNSYYSSLMNRLRKIPNEELSKYRNELGVEGKKVVTIFSQPFNEVDKFDFAKPDCVNELYQTLTSVASAFKDSPLIEVVFKPHPQDDFYLNWDFGGAKIVKNTDLSKLLMVSDLTISCFSTMAIQSYIANKITIGYLPEYFSDAQRKRVFQFFDMVAESTEDLLDLLKQFQSEELCFGQNKDVNSVVDLSLDTYSVIHKFLHDKVCVS